VTFVDGPVLAILEAFLKLLDLLLGLLQIALKLRLLFGKALDLRGQWRGLVAPPAVANEATGQDAGAEEQSVPDEPAEAINGGYIHGDGHGYFLYFMIHAVRE
jgi:hypothetical protein